MGRRACGAWKKIRRWRRRRLGQQIAGGRRSVVGRPTIVLGQDCCCRRLRYRLWWRRHGGGARSRVAEGAKRLGSLRRYQYSVVPVELYASHAYKRCIPSSLSSSIAVMVDTAQFWLSFPSLIFRVLFFPTVYRPPVRYRLLSYPTDVNTTILIIIIMIHLINFLWPVKYLTTTLRGPDVMMVAD